MEIFSKIQEGYSVPGAIKTNISASTASAVQQNIQQSSDLHSEKESNPLTKALAGLAVLGAGVAGVAIYMKIKKKAPLDTGDLKNISQTAADAVDDIQKNAKKFFGINGDEITEKINLKKGKAFFEDGSGFSGTLKTVNKKGNEISICYKDGFMINSSIDGKEFRSFKNLESKPNVLDNPVIKYSRDEGVLITQFNEYGNIQAQISHVYDKKGRISRVYKEPAGEFATAIDFADGKVAAKTVFGRDGIKNAEVFDKDGSVIKTIERCPYGTGNSVVEILPDGTKKEKIGFLEYDRVATPAVQYGDKMNLHSVIKHDSNGKKIEYLYLSNGRNMNQLSLTNADGSIFSISIPAKLKPKEGDVILPRFDFLPSDESKSYYAVISASGKNLRPNSASHEQLLLLQKQAQELMAKAKAEGIEFPYKRAEEYLPKIFNV